MSIEGQIIAERECTEQEDIKPDKVLRPIGTRFREWIEDKCSTEPDGWVTWEIIGYGTTGRGRRDDTLLYERYEEIRLVDDDKENDDG